MQTIVVFFEMTFAYLIIFRNLDQLRTEKLLSAANFRASFLFFMCWCLFWSLIPQIQTVQITFLVWLPVLVSIILPRWIVFHHRKLFRREFLIVLNRVILKMNNGLALRPAFLTSCYNLSGFSHAKIIKIIENLNFDNSKPQLEHEMMARNLINYLKRVEKDTHLSIQRLKHLREQYKTVENFEAKKKQALHPIRAQMILLTILYLVGLSVILINYANSQNLKLVGLSVPLFLVGLLWEFKLARGFKWTV